MQPSLVMTIIGPDRPGLVESVARVVAQNGGNWLESRMSRLGGQFAGILRVEVPTGQEQRVASALQALSTEGLTVVVHADRSAQPAAAARLNILEIVGQDRPGIVNQITHALAEQKVNVEELETECASAAMSGEMLFKARAKLSIPESASAADIRKRLEKIAEDLIVEISLEEITKS
jgi:glycine cleavage system regulatory protein